LDGFFATPSTSWWTSTPARTSGPPAADSSGSLFSDEEFAGYLPFLGIKAFVAILVEAGHQ